MDSVLHLGPEAGRALRGEADFDSLHGLHGNDGLRQAAIQTRIPRHMRSQPHGDAARHHLENAADGIAGAVRLVDHCFHADLGFRVHAAEQDFRPAAESGNLIPGGRALEPHGAHGNHVAQHLDAEFAQQRLGQRAHGHARRRFAGAGALQNVARVMEIVLDGARQVGMAGPRPRHRLALVIGALGRFHGKRLSPVLPIPIADQDGHGRADGAGMADAGHDQGAVLLDLHAAAAAVALLAAPQLVVDGAQRYGYAGGKPCERRHEALAMGLSGGLKAQHRMRILIVADSNNYLAGCVVSSAGGVAPDAGLCRR